MAFILGNNGAGDLTAELQMFTYGGTLRARPISLSGPLVNKSTKSKKAKAATPRAMLGTPDKPDFRPLNTNFGHLMGMQFEGLNVPENVVPMYASFNQHGQWKSVEKELKKLVKGNHGRITIDVAISYTFTPGVFPSDPRIPTGFSVVARNNIQTLWTSGFIPHIAPASEFVPIDDDEANLIISRYWEMKQSGWTMDAAYPNLILPPQGVKRPYEVLDYMTEVTQDIANVTIMNARKFSDYQINNILTVNRVYNEGSLLPDDPYDPFAATALLSVAGDQGPHVDHIMPKATTAGCNAYSNATVLSSLGNMRKSTRHA